MPSLIGQVGLHEGFVTDYVCLDKVDLRGSPSKVSRSHCWSLLSLFLPKRCCRVGSVSVKMIKVLILLSWLEEFAVLLSWWNLLWCIGGDFNISHFPSERSGEACFSPACFSLISCLLNPIVAGSILCCGF